MKNRMYPMMPMGRPMPRNMNQKIYINPKFGLIGNNEFNNQFMRYNQPMYGNMNMMPMNPMNPMMHPMMPMNPGMRNQVYIYIYIFFFISFLLSFTQIYRV